MRFSFLLFCSLVSGCGCGVLGPNDPHQDDTGEACDRDGDGYHSEACGGCDTDDSDPSIPELTPEVCDGLDNDCDGEIDEGVLLEWHEDADGDGWGSDASTGLACEQPEGWLDSAGDCDDSDDSVHPGAEDAPCDGVDSDCDGVGATTQAALEGVEYALLTDALAAAPDGSEVLVCPGTHEVEAEIGAGRTLTLASWSGDPEGTILSGGEAHRILRIREDTSVTLRELGFHDGLQASDGDLGAPYGGAILAIDADLVIEGCSLQGNIAATTEGEGYGGAVAFLWAAPGAAQRSITISGCDFAENRASGGGAVYISGNGPPVGRIRINDSTFSSNEGTSSSSSGGALYVGSWTSSLDVVMERDVIDNNEAHTGGALYLLTSQDGDELSISDSVFTNNEASSSEGGGAIRWYHSGRDDDQLTQASLLIDGCQFEDNSSPHGGVFELSSFWEAPRLVIRGSSFVSNSTLVGGQGGVLTSTALKTTLEISGSTFTGNTADLDSAIACIGILVDVFEASIQDSSFSDNHTGYQGALLATAAREVSLEIVGTDLHDNSSTQGEAAIYLMGTEKARVTLDRVSAQGNSSQGLAAFLGIPQNYVGETELIIQDSTFAGNSAAGEAGAILVGPQAEVSVVNTDWGSGASDNSPCDLGLGHTTVETSYCDLGAAETFTCSRGAGCSW